MSGPVEGNPIRDNGPYLTVDQAAAQFDAATFGTPPGVLNADTAREMLLLEALMITGVTASEFERLVIVQLSRSCSSTVAQVIAGWIVRSNLAGRDAAR